jgi:hypothetical protein
MLVMLAKQAFDAASWPTTINTGRYMYPLSNNVRNVEDADSQRDGAFARAKKAFQT